ncbi:MAG: metallopeptidase (SprT family) [Proteobacteria bacterium]|nr:MAG: metallopeptidase (SprT family) [Pseudomonadota bacterium]
MTADRTGARTARDDVLGPARRTLVLAETRRRVRQAARCYGVQLADVAVVFDLGGASVGMYCARGGHRRIRFNPHLFARHFEENLRDTVAHEVAHYVVDVLFGREGVKPHGAQWREAMRKFGVTPTVRHEFDLRGLSVRRQRRFAYVCDCREHQLTTVRHNRVVARRAVYHCRRCGAVLRMRND